jgi:hypothetical protein
MLRARSLVLGVPAKLVRSLKDEELAWKLEATMPDVLTAGGLLISYFGRG